MVEILLNMICLGISAYLIGYAFLRLMRYSHNTHKENDIVQLETEIDLDIVMGICVLTIYAQTFSLFYKVGALAFGIVVLIDFLIILFFREHFVYLLKKRISIKLAAGTVLLIFIVYMAIVLANQPITYYDTDLYHAQSIHWLESYGIVPGLGNLHNRLAYNSSFFALQALFSWKFMLGHSLHCVNAFAYVFFFFYSIRSAKVYKYKKFFASDFLRIAIIIYLSNNLAVNSPNTDYLALELVLYVFAKWVELWEESTGVYAEKYAILSLIALFAVSVKLSAGMMILLAIYPIIQLVLMRDCKMMIKYLCIGIVFISPFLIRNIIISGYLLYPYSKIDLFAFDWKMPSYMLDFDSHEIRAWGRGLNDVRRFNAGFGEWFPLWLSRLNNMLKILVYSSIPCAVISLAIGIWHVIKKKDINLIIIAGTMVANIVLWFTGAPLVRYGMCYILILLLFTSGYVFSLFKENINKYAIIVMVGISLIQSSPLVATVIYAHPVLQYNSDYNNIECNTAFLDGVEIYCPISGDQTGYYGFPSTPYVKRLKLIQMRGNSIKNGFKIKEEHKGKFISTYGNVAEFNMFEIKSQEVKHE